MLTGYPLSFTLGRSVLGIGRGVARFLMTAEYATYRYLRCVVNVKFLFQVQKKIKFATLGKQILKGRDNDFKTYGTCVLT